MPTTTTIPTGGPVPYDPDGHQVVGRTPLTQSTAGGTLVAAGAVNTALTAVAGASEKLHVQRVHMQCTVAPTVDGVITIQDSLGGGIILNVEAVTTFAKGQQLDFEFLTPVKLANAASGVAVSAPANSGTWRYFVDGFPMNDNIVV